MLRQGRLLLSRARGSRCGPFIVAAVIVEHEDYIPLFAQRSPRASRGSGFRNAWRWEMRSDDEETIARVAALDIGKAELVCCVRVPGAGCREERITGGLDPFDDDQVVGRSGESPGRPACRASGDGGDLRLLAAGVLHAGGPR